MNRTALLMVGHGSRQPDANREFEELVAVYRRQRPDLTVAHGYIELADPPVAVALANLAATAQRVVVFPVLLFAAGHVKNDIPLALAAVRGDYPDVDFVAARPLGVHPAMTELSLQRPRQAAVPEQEEAQTVLVVGRGSSDPDANADFFKVVRLFEESAPFQRVLPCFIGVARPTFEQTLEWAARGRPERLLVVPYLLFAGQAGQPDPGAPRCVRGALPVDQDGPGPPSGSRPEAPDGHRRSNPGGARGTGSAPLRYLPVSRRSSRSAEAGGGAAGTALERPAQLHAHPGDTPRPCPQADP